MKLVLAASTESKSFLLIADQAEQGRIPSKQANFRQGSADESESVVASVADSLPRDPLPQAGESQARLSVALPRTLYRQIRLLALDQDTTLSALVARLIRKELG
jgi:hypothetical protein